ncbi:unnamed protein product [Hydatigera taeniaeformis]|uniref:OAR domain-containing protein n=1 Tax=Hydatigena taeniaeformis TaxID=6205 RepID=A0A0R3X1D9_HYDTA|nr:unnamed protein product [Hydatigera taeniaeformis]
MNVWFPFGQGNDNKTDDSNIQRGVEESPTHGTFESTPRTAQFWGLAGKETYTEQSSPVIATTSTVPLMSAAAAAMAHSFFTGEPIDTTNTPLNSLLTAAAASNRHQETCVRVEGFVPSRRSPASSAASEQSAPSPHRTFYPPADGYQQGYAHSTVPRIDNPNLPPPLPPPLSLSQPPPPPLPPPPLHHTPNYSIGSGTSSTAESNPGVSALGNVGGNMEQIWPWMTVVGK